MKKQVFTQLHEQLENVYKNHRLIVKPEMPRAQNFPFMGKEMNCLRG